MVDSMAPSWRCLSTWWAPLPSKQAVRAIPVRRVRFPSTSAFYIPLHMASHRTFPKLLALVFAAAMVMSTVVVVTPNTLAAQARLLESSPSDGDSLLSLENIRFEFDSLLISDAAATVTLTRTNGAPIPVADVMVVDAVLTARILEEIPSGTYDVGYAVRSADGALNEGTLRVTVDAPSQALSGGLLAVIGIFAALATVIVVVFTADKRRRPGGQRKGPRSEPLT